MPEPALVPISAPCPRGNRTMAKSPQHQAPTFGARTPSPKGVPDENHRVSA
jgi:hypothetical protein